MKSTKDILFTIFVAVCLILFLKLFVLDFRVVASESMEPTFIKGDIVVISKLGYEIFGIDYKDPKIDDIIAFTLEDELLIKRVTKISINDELFVTGDNTDKSYDSRDFGYITRSTIEGRAIIKLNFTEFSFSFLD